MKLLYNVIQCKKVKEFNKKVNVYNNYSFICIKVILFTQFDIFIVVHSYYKRKTFLLHFRKMCKNKCF